MKLVLVTRLICLVNSFRVDITHNEWPQSQQLVPPLLLTTVTAMSTMAVIRVMLAIGLLLWWAAPVPAASAPRSSSLPAERIQAVVSRPALCHATHILLVAPTGTTTSLTVRSSFPAVSPSRYRCLAAAVATVASACRAGGVSGRSLHRRCAVPTVAARPFASGSVLTRRRWLTSPRARLAGLAALTEGLATSMAGTGPLPAATAALASSTFGSRALRTSHTGTGSG
jgi:hypothetical protein